MTVSVDAEKHLAEFPDKNFQNNRNGGNVINLIKSTSTEKPTSNITLNGERLISAKMVNQAQMFQPVQQAEEEINRQIRKEEIKLFLFTDYMIVYGENPKESTTKFLVCPRKLIREFSKVTGHKNNTQNQLHFYLLGLNTWPPKLKIQHHLQPLKNNKRNTSVQISQNLYRTYIQKPK